MGNFRSPQGASLLLAWSRPLTITLAHAEEYSPPSASIVVDGNSGAGRDCKTAVIDRHSTRDWLARSQSHAMARRNSYRRSSNFRSNSKKPWRIVSGSQAIRHKAHDCPLGCRRHGQELVRPACGSGVLVSAWSLLIRRHQRARRQAETPPIVLCRFSGPALCFE